MLPVAFRRLLGHFRERIEGVFNEVQNTGRNLERLLREKVEGMCVHVAAKMANHTLRILLPQHFGINVLSFESINLNLFSPYIVRVLGKRERRLRCSNL